MSQSIQEHLSEIYLNLLQIGGVDNWDWYSDALEGVNTDDSIAVVDALRNSGVDNWEWHDESLGDFSYYVDYVKENPENYVSYDEWTKNKSSYSKLPETNAPVVVPAEVEKPELSAQNLMLLDYLKKSFNEDDAHKILNIISSNFWKYSTSPKDFTKALSVVKRGEGTLLKAAQNYLDIMIKNKKLDQIISEAAKELK